MRHDLKVLRFVAKDCNILTRFRIQFQITSLYGAVTFKVKFFIKHKKNLNWYMVYGFIVQNTQFSRQNYKNVRCIEDIEDIEMRKLKLKFTSRDFRSWRQWLLRIGYYQLSVSHTLRNPLVFSIERKGL